MCNQRNLVIIDLIAFFGSQLKMGNALGVSQSLISQWLNGKCGIGARNALKIEKLTAGKFKAVELCPHLAELDTITPKEPAGVHKD